MTPRWIAASTAERARNHAERCYKALEVLFPPDETGANWMFIHETHSWMDRETFKEIDKLIILKEKKVELSQKLPKSDIVETKQWGPKL